MHIWKRLTPAGHGVFVGLVCALIVGVLGMGHSALSAWLATLAALGLLALGLGMVITWRW